MSTIPISLTKDQFDEHILPHLSTAKRGFVCKTALYRVFDYILYRFHTGCQWAQLPIAADPVEPTKKKSVGKRCITIFGSGAETGASREYGSTALRAFKPNWTCRG